MNKLNFLLISLLFHRSSPFQEVGYEAEGSSIDDPGTPEASAPEDDVMKFIPEGLFLKEKRKKKKRKKLRGHETDSDTDVLFLKEIKKSTLPGRKTESDSEVLFLKEKKRIVLTKKQKRPQEEEVRPGRPGRRTRYCYFFKFHR